MSVLLMGIITGIGTVEEPGIPVQASGSKGTALRRLSPIQVWETVMCAKLLHAKRIR